MSPLPYLAAIGAACVPLFVLIASDRIAARKVVLSRRTSFLLIGANGEDHIRIVTLGTG
ncbi:MAG: hypothetical protein GY773_10575 [Actinomycetia bacterium]|nr:hypothetical protein [Actinomycetes bacterium]